MTKPKRGVSRNRSGKWTGKLAEPVILPRDATNEQQIAAATELDERMRLLASRYRIDLDGICGWQLLATLLAADTVPGLFLETRGRNEHPKRKNADYLFEIALARAWAERSIGKHGASVAAARMLAKQISEDNISASNRARQIQNDLSAVPDHVRQWAANTVNNFFALHPEQDDTFS